jgi:hypothetical protein
MAFREGSRWRGLVGLLQAAGYAMLPGGSGKPEHPAFTGGYTVETYGSHHADGIDAIQLEIVAELRRLATPRARLAADLAAVIASLLPLAPVPDPTAAPAVILDSDPIRSRPMDPVFSVMPRLDRGLQRARRPRPASGEPKRLRGAILLAAARRIGSGLR